MAKIVIAPDGVKLAKAPGMGNKTPPKRGNAGGWTKAVARRNNDFLMSVDGEELANDPGSPFALSLTFGRSEEVTPAALRDSREALFHRFRRMGVTRLHWLVEFQGDGVPHLHMILYLPQDAARGGVEAVLRGHWLEVAGWSGAHLKGQHVVPVSHLRGWKQYLGKHGIRGVHHYQRQMPEGWEEPGRMWGKLGQWPTRSLELECDLATFFRFRRILRSYRVAEARSLLAKAAPDKMANLRRSLGFARRCLREPNPEGSPKATLRGMNLWVPEYTSLRVATFLANAPSALVRPWQHRAETVPALTK